MRNENHKYVACESLEKSLPSRILLAGGKQKEVASYKTQARLVVAAAGGGDEDF